MVPIGIAQDGRWVLESGDPERLRIKSADELPSVDGSGASISLARATDSTDLVVSEPSAAPADPRRGRRRLPAAARPVGRGRHHPGHVRDGRRALRRGGVLASAVSMDKAFMKVVLAGAGVPLMPSVVVTAREWRDDRAACRKRVAALGYPAFVKPARGGSSFGISKAHDASELDEAMAVAQREDPKVLVEAYAAGAREVECGVLGHARRRLRDQRPRRGAGDRGPRVLRLRGEVPPRGGHRAGRAGRPP